MLTLHLKIVKFAWIYRIQKLHVHVSLMSETQSSVRPEAIGPNCSTYKVTGKVCAHLYMEFIDVCTITCC